MEPQTKQNFLKLGWILFLILLSMILGAIFIPKFVGAAQTWPLNQTETCNLPSINLTGIYCDAYWCQNFVSNETQNCSYNLLTSGCSCVLITPVIENETIIINCSSPNITLSDFNTYCNIIINCSSTNITIADWQIYCNITKNDTNNSDVRAWVNEQFGIFRDSNKNFTDQEITFKFFELMGNNSYFGNQQQITISGKNLIIIVAIICITLGFLGWRYSVKKKQNLEDLPKESIRERYKGKSNEITNKDIENFEKSEDSEEGIFESKEE